MAVKSQQDVVIAANPGWFLVEYWRDVNRDGLFHTAIIAWLIETKRETYPTWANQPHDDTYLSADPRPITLEGVASEHDRWAVKSPDGTYAMPLDQSFDSADALLTELREREARERERKQAKEKTRSTSMNK